VKIANPRNSTRYAALLLSISILVSPLALIPAVSAKASLDALLIPGTGFNDGTSGWDTLGGLTAEGTTIQINNNPQNNWVYTTNGAKSGRLQPQGSNTFATVLQSSLGLTSTEVTAVRAAFKGDPTNSAWTFRTVTLEAGVTYRMAWSYTSTDYAPFNDGSLTTLVPISGNPTITVNNSAKRWALLGFTVPPTGIYSTGDYGSTGWQIATYQVDTTGDYKLGFSAFNIGDTSFPPVLIIDDERGSVTRSGVPFGAVAPNDASAPNIATSVSPSTQTVTGTPGVAITSTSVLTATGLNGTVSFSSGTLPAGLTLNTSTGVVSGTPTATSTSTVTITATGSSSGTATSSMIFSIKNAQAPLVLSSTQGTQGTPLALSVTGGSGTGNVTYTVANGTASGCTISGGNLSASTPGTCLVTATKAADSSFTAIASSQTAVTFIGRPGIPTIDSITNTDDGISIAFTPPASTGGSPITNYKYSLDDGQTFLEFSPAQTISPLVVTGLVGGTDYDVKIRAINIVGEGTSSTRTAVTFLAKPGPPSIGSITPGDKELSVAFTAPASDGGETVTNYMYSLDNGVTFVSLSPAQTTSPLRITNLIAGTTYSVKIRAVNSIGQGAASATVNASTNPVLLPTPTPTTTQTVTPQPPTAVVTPVRPARVIPPTPSPSPTPSPQTQVDLNKPVAVPSGSVVSVTTGSGATQQVTIGPNGLPELRPLQSLALVAGAPVPVQVSQVASNTALKIDGGEFNVTLSASSASGTSSSLNSLGELVLTSGNFATFSGTGFAPNSQIVVWLFSTPTKLGEVVTDASGSFSGSLEVPSDLEAGQHTVQLNGQTSDGETRSLAVGVELVAEESVAEESSEEAQAASIGATGDDNAPPVPFDPLASPEGVTALTASIGAAAAAAGAIAAAAGAAAGAAGSSSGGSARGGSSSGGGNSGGDSGSIATIDAAHERYRNRRSGKGDRWKIWKKRWLNFLDKPFISLAVKSARFSPLFSKISVDGAYLRASMGSLGLLPTIAAAIISVMSVSMNETAVAPPQWQWFIALAVIGIFDAFAGLVGTSIFVIGTVIMHGAIGIEDIRLLLGVMIVGYGPALLANAFRAFRKEPENSDVYWWDRLIDLAVLPFIGGWITATMISTLPALAGTTLAVANHVDTFAIAIAVAIMARVILEELVARWFPKRLDTLHPTDVDETDSPQKWISVAFRLAVFIFVTAALMGNVWQVWVGSALFILPTIIGFYADKFKNFPWLWRLLPTGVPGLAVALLVASATTSVVGMWFGTSPDLALWSFALLPIPMLFLALLGLFGREGADEDEVRWIQRPQFKWVYRIGGIVMLLFTMNLAGVI
jgi:hypothetical protein